MHNEEDEDLFEKQNCPQKWKVNLSLNGEFTTPPWASHILHSRVTPANINICFSFQAAVVLCSGGVKKGGESEFGEYDLQTGYYSE